jgi:hypothetical protein
MAALTEQQRSELRRLRQAIDDARLSAHARVRVYRNVLFVTSALLVAGLILFTWLVIPFLASDLAVIRQSPSQSGSTTASGSPSQSGSTTASGSTSQSGSTTASGSTSQSGSTTASSGKGQEKSARADLMTVEAWGVVGGLIGALVALRNLQASRRPIGLQLAQLVLKLPAGAVTALFGVVLLQSNILPALSPVPFSELAAYAILFGFAQEAVTGMVDRQAARLLNEAKSISDKTSES